MYNKIYFTCKIYKIIIYIKAGGIILQLFINNNNNIVEKC